MFLSIYRNTRGYWVCTFVTYLCYQYDQINLKYNFYIKFFVEMVIDMQKRFKIIKKVMCN